MMRTEKKLLIYKGLGGFYYFGCNLNKKIMETITLKDGSKVSKAAYKYLKKWYYKEWDDTLDNNYMDTHYPSADGNISFLTGEQFKELWKYVTGLDICIEKSPTQVQGSDPNQNKTKMFLEEERKKDIDITKKELPDDGSDWNKEVIKLLQRDDVFITEISWDDPNHGKEIKGYPPCGVKPTYMNFSIQIYKPIKFVI